MRGRRGDAILGIAILIIIIIVLVWLARSSMRECTSDRGCGSESYCGADFKCHPMKVIEKTVIRNEYNFSIAGFFVAIAIVAAAVILRQRKK